MKRIPSLDGLRAISIGLVFAAHLEGARHFFSSETMRQAGDLGNLGVRVFFLISGYLITNLLLAELAKTHRISLRSFYFRRVLRIFPAFYLFLLVVCVLALTGRITISRLDLLHASTYTSNYHYSEHFALGHLWSLSVEEQFYLLWPVTLGLLGVTRASIGLVGTIVIVPFVRIAIYHLHPGYEEHIDKAFETVCDALAMGCLLAILLPRLQRQRWFVDAIASPAFLILLPAVWLVNKQTAHPHFLWLLGVPFMNLVIALTIARYVLFPRTVAGRLLNTRPLVAIGVYSYSLYLWQQLFLTQWRAPESILQVFPLNVLMACACGMLSYTLVERPFLRLRDRFRRKAGAASAAAGLTVDSGQRFAPALAIVESKAWSPVPRLKE